MRQHQDEYYVDKVINGETNAFSFLVDRYKHMVFTLAFRIVKHNEEAEEVAQDTFLKVYNSLQTFKGDSKFSTWVYKIAYHQSLDYLKKRKKNLITDSLEDCSIQISPLEGNVLDQMENEEQNLVIKKALELVPSEDGILITLYYFDELSLKEISKIMDISANTVKVKLFRARKKMADLLNVRLEAAKIEKYERNGY